MRGPTMQAAVIAQPRTVELVELPIPEPGPNQIRVRIQGCGVCGSNLPSWEGRDWFQYPLPPGAPGHEGWGVVDRTGEDVTDIEPGEPVAMVSSSAFAEYELVPRHFLARLPPSLEGQPFPGEAIGCAVNVIRRSEIRREHTVAVVGIGFLGALIVRLASNVGARTIAISRRRFSLGLALQCGAAEALAMEDRARIVERVRDLTNGRGCDRVIEATGTQAALDLASELTRERGRLVIAGYHQDGPRRVNMQLWNWRGLDVINAHERDPRIYVRGIELAAEAVCSGQLDPRPLYTHSFPLEQLGGAFEMMSERPDGFLKALFVR